MSDDARLEVLDSIYSDLVTLAGNIKKNSSSYPMGIIKQCFIKKSKTFEDGIGFGSEVMKSTARFYKLFANYSWLLENHEEAYKYFLKASEKTPTDFDIRRKAFEAWLSWKSSTLKNIDPKQISESDLAALLKESDSILLPLIEGNQVPIDIKINSLITRATLIESITGKVSQSIFDWKKVVDLSPKNVEALQKIVAYELSRKNLVDAKPYLLKLAPLTPSNLEVQRSLLEALYIQKDSEMAREWAKKFLDLQKSDPIVLSFAAWAFFESQDFTNSKKYALKSIKLDPKNVLAKSTMAKILLTEGDLAVAAKDETKAIGLYEKSLQYDPKQSTVLKKLGFLIYDTLQKTKGLSSKAKARDMQRASELLYRYLKIETPDSSILVTLVETSTISKQYKIGEFACSKHLKDFGLFPTPQSVIDCSIIFQKVGHTPKAKKLLEDALQEVRYTGSKSVFSDQLVKIVSLEK